MDKGVSPCIMDVPALETRRAPSWPLVLATPGWVNQASQLEFNYDFEQFFPADHPETKFYRDFRDQFGSDNDLLIVGFEGDSCRRRSWPRSMAMCKPCATSLPWKACSRPTQLAGRDPLSGWPSSGRC